MYETPHALHSRKRPSAGSKPPSKRRKCAGDRDFYPSSVFWDNLSTVHLTRSALRELDQRNTGSAEATRPQSVRGVIPVNDYLQTRSVETLKHLRRVTRQGGLDMSKQRGCRRLPSTAESSSRSSSQHAAQASTTSGDQSSTNTSTTRSTKPAGRNFRQHLIDHHIYPANHSILDRDNNPQPQPKPDNWSKIKDELRQRRRSLSPSQGLEDAFERFRQTETGALKEQQVRTRVMPIIEGEIRDVRCGSGDLRLTNLDPLTDGTLAPGNPDIYYGARPEQLNKHVRDALNGKIIPSTQDDLPACPNFVTAVKGCDGKCSVGLHQACYDGALFARGQYYLHTYGRALLTPINDAFTISAFYFPGMLQLFTLHCVESEGQLHVYMNQLRSFAMTDTKEVFREGCEWYRNGLGWTEAVRNAAIKRANSTIDTTERAENSSSSE